MSKRISLKLTDKNDWLVDKLNEEKERQNRPSFNNMVETILVEYFEERGQQIKTANENADTRTEPALPIQSVMASVSDELLLRAVKYEDEANADFDTDGVQHNLNIGRYDGLMQAVQEINKHLP